MLTLNLAIRKRCTKCRERLSTGRFSCHSGRNDGLSNVCVDCKKEAAHDSYVRHKVHVRAKNDAWAKANAERKKAADARWYRENKERHDANVAAWHQRNPGWKRVYDASYYEQHGERMRSGNRIRNRLRYRTDEDFRNAVSRNSARWLQANKHLHAQHVLLRTHRKRGRMLAGPIADEQLAQRASAFGNVCAYCGGRFECWDHVKSLHRGGPHCLSNLRPACRRCNSSKGAKRLADWLAHR